MPSFAEGGITWCLPGVADGLLQTNQVNTCICRSVRRDPSWCVALRVSQDRLKRLAQDSCSGHMDDRS
jgi:hypothetical protein